jgi:hypothetical protein
MSDPLQDSRRVPETESREVERLRRRIEELEDELAVQAARVNDVIAEAQRRTYWLDQLDLDLNVSLRRPLLRYALVIPLKVVRRLRRERGRIKHRLR